MLDLKMLAKMVLSTECSPLFPGTHTLQVMCSSITKDREREGTKCTRRVPFKVYARHVALKAHETLLWPVPFFLFVSFPVHLGAR